MTCLTGTVAGASSIVCSEVLFGFCLEFFVIVSRWIVCSCNNIYINTKKLCENVPSSSFVLVGEVKNWCVFFHLYKYGGVLWFLGVFWWISVKTVVGKFCASQTLSNKQTCGLRDGCDSSSCRPWRGSE